MISPLPPLAESDLNDVLAQTESLWPQLAAQRLFLIGGSGFWGSWLLESALAADRRWQLGLELTVLTRDPLSFAHRSPHLASAVKIVTGSVLNLSAAAAVRRKFDAVLHLTTEADNQKTVAHPEAARAVIAGGTQRALEFAHAVGARRFLCGSSGAVYGRQPPLLDRLSEGYPGRPDSTNLADAYAIAGGAKLEAEAACVEMQRQHGMECVIARGFTFAGPYLPLEGKFAFGNFLSDALAGRDIVIKGDGTPVRSYLYAADMTAWLWTLLLRGESGRAYNVGSPQPVALRELAEVIRQEISPHSRVVVLAASDPQRAIDRYVPDVTRAASELGLAVRTDLSSAVRRTAEWARRALRH